VVRFLTAKLTFQSFQSRERTWRRGGTTQRKTEAATISKINHDPELGIKPLTCQPPDKNSSNHIQFELRLGFRWPSFSLQHFLLQTCNTVYQTNTSLPQSVITSTSMGNTMFSSDQSVTLSPPTSLLSFHLTTPSHRNNSLQVE
jgi:hypothetical protein